MSDYKYKIGESVQPIPRWQEEGGRYKGSFIVVKRYQVSQGNCYTISNGKYINEFWENYLVSGVSLSKEEQLYKKIDQLWKRQPYYKTLVSSQETKCQVNNA